MKTFVLFAAIAAGSLLLSASAHADFADVTPDSTLDNGTNTIGVTWLDFDGDGDLDLFRAGWTGVASASAANELWRNDGDADGDGVPALVDIAPASPLLQNLVPINAGGAWADFEGDGDLDVLINCGNAGNKMLRNDGDVTFADISPAGLDTTPSGRTPVWVDFDRDGDLDVYLADTGTGSRMLRNDGAAWATVNGGALSFAAQSTTFGDYDGDLFPDLFSANSSQNQLARNNAGSGTFSAVATATIGNPVGQLGTGLADFDNDGDLDVLQTKSTTQSNRMYRNDGADVFVDVAAGDLLRTSTNATTVTVADYDNDGDIDIFEGDESGDGGALLRNDGSFSFVNVTAELVGLDAPAAQYAAGFGDYDADGDQDLFIATFTTGAPQLFRNDLSNGNHWLKVDLRGTVSNGSGVGAVVRVTTGVVTQMRRISGGGDGWCSQETLVAEFGLGVATTADEIRVEWPSGQVSVLNGIPADQVVRVEEPGFASTTTSYAPNLAFTFQVPTNGAPVDAMTLFFRVAGSGAAFQSAPMASVGGGTAFEVGVGQSFATEDGLEGFIVYTLNGGSPQTYPFGGAPAPAFLPAALPNQVLPELPAGSQYVMYGLPFVPTDSNPVAVLEDDLGAYDQTLWRSFHFDPLAGSNGTYQEHSATDPFAPGRGYWLIMAAPVAIGSTGFSTNTVGGVELEIQRGWNQIAHPYQFPVALANVDFSAAPDVEQEIHEWDSATGAYVTDDELEAWEGYFMFNAAAAPQPITIPGVTSTAPAPAPPVESIEEGWRLAFSASQGNTRDRGNELGSADGATDEPDRLDRHAPPAPPGAVRAYFERVAADGTPHELNRDLLAAREGTWDLAVEAPGEVGARIEVDGISDLPSELEAVLIPLDTWATIDLRERSFVDVPGGRTHRFRVVVGSRAFIETVRSGQDVASVEFALGLGYPNPLASSTKIGFALPAQSNVQLAVYDVTGRKVRTLVNGTRSAGRHVAEWNAQDEAGRFVAPGVYFVKMVAGSREETRKLTVLR